MFGGATLEAGSRATLKLLFFLSLPLLVKLQFLLPMFPLVWKALNKSFQSGRIGQEA
jgi:hypothetical protein